jgi:hypothetical protein
MQRPSAVRGLSHPSKEQGAFMQPPYVEADRERCRACEAASRGPSGDGGRHRGPCRGSAARIPRRNTSAPCAVPRRARDPEALARGTAGYDAPNRGRCSSRLARMAGRRRRRRSCVPPEPLPRLIGSRGQAAAPAVEVASNRADDQSYGVSVHDEPPFGALRLIAKMKPTARTTTRATRAARIVPSIEPPFLTTS